MAAVAGPDDAADVALPDGVRVVSVGQRPDLWPVAYALQRWTPEVEKRVTELVRAAVS